jgi:Transposase DDE domain
VPFKRILIEDSTFVRFPKANADLFPGHGNGHGKTAGCKVDLAFDLLDGDIVYHQLHLSTRQDKTIGYDLLQHILPGDLIVRDMGYFVLENFRAIESCHAYWLSRLPLTANVTTEHGIPLENLLASSQGDSLDLRVKLTAEGHSVRLVAIRASKQETEKRWHEHRSRAKENGKTVSQKTLIRDGWHLMVTNIPKVKYY